MTWAYHRTGLKTLLLCSSLPITFFSLIGCALLLAYKRYCASCLTMAYQTLQITGNVGIKILTGKVASRWWWSALSSCPAHPPLTIIVVLKIFANAKVLRLIKRQLGLVKVAVQTFLFMLLFSLVTLKKKSTKYFKVFVGFEQKSHNSFMEVMSMVTFRSYCHESDFQDYTMVGKGGAASLSLVFFWCLTCFDVNLWGPKGRIGRFLQLQHGLS